MPLLLGNALETPQRDIAQVSHVGGTASELQSTIHSTKCEVLLGLQIHSSGPKLSE